MKFIATSILSIYLFFSFASLAFAQSPSPSVSPTPSATPATVDSFELFWPVVAGRTRGDSFYFLKTFKEKLREMLLFSNFKKADYNIMLSVKRTVEAEKLLLENADIDNARMTLTDAQSKRDRAYDLINQAQSDGKVTTDLINALDSSLEKQELVLLNTKSKIENEEGKNIIDENINLLNDLQSKLRENPSENK